MLLNVIPTDAKKNARVVENNTPGFGLPRNNLQWPTQIFQIKK